MILTSKRSLKARGDALFVKNAEVRDLLEKHQFLVSDLRSHSVFQEGEIARWRARVEVLESSPEIKADTEAAFTRGKQQTLRNIQNWLMSSSLQQLEEVEADA